MLRSLILLLIQGNEMPDLISTWRSSCSLKVKNEFYEQMKVKSKTFIGERKLLSQTGTEGGTKWVAPRKWSPLGNFME